MVVTSVEKELFLVFSDLLNYPRDDFKEKVGKTIDLLSTEGSEIVEELKRFSDAISDIPISRLEELYSGTFDISPSCCIYAGYQIVGEGYKRSEFLVGLNAVYKKYGFKVSNELPDHLAVIFKFLAEIEPFEPTAQELLKDCLLPSLQKMIDGFGLEAISKRKIKDKGFLATVYKENETKRKDNTPSPYFYMLKAIKLYVAKNIINTSDKEEIL